MSRIDEALRRTGRGGTAALDRQDEFVSAWPTSGERATPQPDPSTFERRPEPRRVPEERKDERKATGARRQFNARWRELLAMPEGNPILVEQFRRLAATLHNAQATNGICRLMITSATPGDGKTMTAVNLALVLSESYRRKVLLIDADLRRPSLGDFADLSHSTGLSEGLSAKGGQKLTVVELTPTLTLLPAGQPEIDPIAGLSSPRMKKILEEGAERFDWVILDAPPVGPVTDASLLAELVDGILLVVRAGHTQHPAVQRAIDTVGRDRILGVVFNGLATMPEPYGYYYGADKPASGSQG